MNTSEIRPTSVPASALLSTWTAHDWRDGLKLDEVSALDRITARTCYSTYEIVIVSPVTGEILVRGGQFFPEFAPARLAGASLGGSLLKMRSLYVGFRMELALDGRVIITSPVRTLTVEPASVRAGELM
ncbi:MAG: hypothetical protein HY048_17690 [Acidobacteria bacterium]|nr:hypothetical protein [Acidobacteriota bacterium]